MATICVKLALLLAVVLFPHACSSTCNQHLSSATQSNIVIDYSHSLLDTEDHPGKESTAPIALFPRAVPELSDTALALRRLQKEFVGILQDRSSTDKHVSGFYHNLVGAHNSTTGVQDTQKAQVIEASALKSNVLPIRVLWKDRAIWTRPQSKKSPDFGYEPFFHVFESILVARLHEYRKDSQPQFDISVNQNTAFSQLPNNVLLRIVSGAAGEWPKLRRVCTMLYNALELSALFPLCPTIDQKAALVNSIDANVPFAVYALLKARRPFHNVTAMDRGALAFHMLERTDNLNFIFEWYFVQKCVDPADVDAVMPSFLKNVKDITQFIKVFSPRIQEEFMRSFGRPLLESRFPVNAAIYNSVSGKEVDKFNHLMNKHIANKQ